MIEGRLEGRHSTDYPAWRSSSASNICGRDYQEAEKCFFLTIAATEQHFSSVSLVACLTGRIVDARNRFLAGLRMVYSPLNVGRPCLRLHFRRTALD